MGNVVLYLIYLVTVSYTHLDVYKRQLVCSGLDTQHFLFYGFLKASEKERIRELHDLKYYPFTLVFYEAPHRIRKMLESCKEVLGNRQMCLARELTKKHEEFLRGTIEELLEVVEELKGEIDVYKRQHSALDPKRV